MTLTSEVLAEGRELLDSYLKWHARSPAAIGTQDAAKALDMWLFNNAPALLAAAEENAALRAEVERLKVQSAEVKEIFCGYFGESEWDIYGTPHSAVKGLCKQILDNRDEVKRLDGIIATAYDLANNGSDGSLSVFRHLQQFIVLNPASTPPATEETDG